MQRYTLDLTPLEAEALLLAVSYLRLMRRAVPPEERRACTRIRKRLWTLLRPEEP